MRIASFLVFVLYFACTAWSGEIKASPGKFNVKCPASRLCPDLERYYQACLSTNESNACKAFVKTFRKLTPEYDCQRSIDHTPTKDFTVPAIWLCEEIQGSGAHVEKYINLLQKLKSDDARCFFASSDFRSVLDGYLAEEFYEVSLMEEKKTRELNCPSSGETEIFNSE